MSNGCSCFRLGDWEVNPEACELIGPAGVVRLEAKPMGVLLELAREAGQVVRRNDLIDAVWGEAFVTEEVLTHCVWELRRALGDKARKPTYLQTIPRRGYRLIAPVTWLDEPSPGGAPPGKGGPEIEVPIESPLAPTRSTGDDSVAAIPDRPRSPWRSRPRPALPFAMAFLAIGLAAVGFAAWRHLAHGPALWVAVPPPALDGPSPEDPRADDALPFVAAAVEATVLEGLVTLPDLAVSSGEHLRIGSDDPVAIARASASDEVLSIGLRRAGSGVALVTLRRVAGNDGRVLWSDSFTVPTAAGDALQVADAVRQRLATAYSGRRGAVSLASSVVSATDYVTYLEIRRQVEQGPSEAEQRRHLAAVEGLTDSSPRFVAGHLLAADLARSLYTSTLDRRFWIRGRQRVERARELAPEDPRPNLWLVRLLLQDRDATAARAALEGLDRQAPAHPSLPVLRSDLADLEGDPDSARRILAEAVAIHPSWQGLYRLASLQVRDGLAEEARANLELALDRSPDNPWVLRKLGTLEITSGRLGRAENIYRALLDLDPSATPPRINLGLIHYLGRNYTRAVEIFEGILEGQPEHVIALLNLADSQLAAQQREAALESYRRVSELLDRENLSASRTLLRAQALAHLGRLGEAVDLAQRTVESHPEHLEVLYLASIVYCLAGDETSAAVMAGRALDGGMAPIWFQIPAFEGLRSTDAELRRRTEIPG